MRQGKAAKWVVLAILISSAPATSRAQGTVRSLTLEQAVDLAMRADPLVAEARIAEDRGKLAVLRSQLDRFSLKIDGQLQELWTKSNIGGTVSGTAALLSSDGGQGLFNLSAQLGLPIFSGLRVESTVAMRQKLRDSSTASLRQTRKDTALATARAYWSVRRLALMRDVQAATINRLMETEEVTDARLRAGLAPPIDKNRARSRLLSQQAALADLDGQVLEATVQLAVLLGIERDELVLVDPPLVPDAAPPPVASLLEDAKHGRPELAVARLQAEAQHFAVRISQSNFYPQLNAFGLFQYGNNPYLVTIGARSASDATNPFSGMSGNLTLGATLSMNFFDTFNTWTGMKDALYEEDRLMAEKRRAVRVIDADVRTAHAKLLHLYGRRAPLQAGLEVARDNVKILEARYQNGDALILEFLDAQNELTQAELQLADVSAQLHLAWLELEASLGLVVGARP